jgi:hypothetical protein
MSTPLLRNQVVQSARPLNLGDRSASLLRPILLIVFAATTLYYMVVSIHWVLSADATIMHYVNFLMQHGLKPYIDISDNNMPGAYYTEGLAMRVFGTGDLAWRIYDFFLLAVMATSLIVIARPYDWVAGVFAAGFFIVIHAAEGAAFSVEREQVIMTLLLVGYAALFTAVRRQTPVLLIILGVSCGLAASIKPTFLPIPFALLGLAAYVLLQRKVSIWPYLVWALVGFIAVFTVDLAFLLHYHAVHPFLFIVRIVSPTYVGTGRLSLAQLTAVILPRNLRLLPFLVVATMIASWKSRARWTWEKSALLMGVGFGLLSFFVQGKGFLHHRYTFLVLLLLLVGFELLDALKHHGASRWLAFVTFAFVMVVVLPKDVRATVAADRHVDPLQMDLQRLGGSAMLQDKVQCFDMVYGCFSALYHLNLVENTGFTGDLLFFTERDGVASKYYKQKFWKLAQSDPATILVVSNEWFGKSNSFNKLNTWPQFAEYLQQNYTLVVERRFAPNAEEQDPNKFRLYIRNRTTLLATAQAMASAGQL